jgi:hypothetical protein
MLVLGCFIDVLVGMGKGDIAGGRGQGVDRRKERGCISMLIMKVCWSGIGGIHRRRWCMIFVGHGAGEGVGGRCRNCNYRTGVGFRFKDYKEVSMECSLGKNLKKWYSNYLENKTCYPSYKSCSLF